MGSQRVESFVEALFFCYGGESELEEEGEERERGFEEGEEDEDEEKWE